MARKVFVSYCKEDIGWLDKVKKFIIPSGLKDSGNLDLWDDSRIPPGSEWNDEIHNAIVTSQCSLLLVSQDFLNSEFIWKHEVPKLIELRTKGHIVLWILVRPATIAKANLTQLQALHATDVALSKLSDADQEQALVNIANEFERAVDLSLGGPPGGAPAVAAQEAPTSSIVLPSPPSTRRIPKDMLHTLIDREPQELPFVSAASNKARTPGSNILLLPYSTQDCPDLLMRRIEDYTFPVRINQAAQLRNITWPKSAADSVEGLRSYVSDVLASESIIISPSDIGTASADEKTALETFRKKVEKRALVFWSDTQKDAPDAEQKKLLCACIKWWMDLDYTEAFFPLALFSFRHRAPAALNLKDLKDYSGWYEGCLDQIKGPRMIDPLQPITLDDVDSWLSLDPIRKNYDMSKVRSAAEQLFGAAASLPLKRIRQEFEDIWLGKIADRSG
jgi:TIR domain